MAASARAAPGRRLVIALGGNAIIPVGQEGTYEQQAAVTRATMKQVARLASEGNQVVVTFGNGPVVGNIVLRHDAGMAVVGLHELLDRQTDPVDEAELLRDVLLIRKGQAILLTTSPQMKEVSDAPEHFPRGLQLPNLAGEKSSGAHVVLLVPGSPTSPSCPFRDIHVP
mgnify:CR=1 FL=1